MSIEIITNLLLEYGAKILSAAVVLFAGLVIIKIVVGLTQNMMRLNKMDVTLYTFIASIINMSLKIMLFVTVISMLGIQMTSFIAILGAAGLAIGLAFQGTLSNFASGVLILIFRPFNVGNYIETQGMKGFVGEIQILYTILLTEDNKKIILPNSGIYSNVIAVDSKKKRN